MKRLYILCSFFLLITFVSLPKLLEIPGVLEPWLVTKGLIYYKDFATFHFPLGRLILLPFYYLTNWNLLSGPFLALVLNIGILYFLYKLGREKNRFLLSATLIFYSLFVWRLATAVMFYHEMLIGILLLIATIMTLNLLSQSLNSANLFNLGFLLSIIELCGQIATPSVITLGVIVLIQIIIASRKIFARLLIFVIGGALPLFAISLYFYFHHALKDFFFWNFTYYTTYEGYNRPSLLELPWKELSIFYLPLVLLGVSLFQKFKADKLVIFLVCLSTLPFVLLSVFHFHHVSYAMPVVAASFLYLYPSKTIKWGIVLEFILLAILILPWYKKAFTNPSFKIVNDVYPPDPMSTTVDWIKSNTSEQSTILVASDPLFYYRSGRLPGNKHMYVSPYNWEPFDSLIRPQLTSPDYWIIDTNFLLRLRKDYGSDNIVQYLEEETQRDYTLEFTADNWQIWKKN